MRNIFLLPILLFTVQIHAQSNTNKRVAWGFFTAAETQAMRSESLTKRFPEQPRAWPTRRSLGMSAGIFGRKPIFRWLDFQPTLSAFWGKNEFKFSADGISEYRFFDLDLPMHFVISDWRRKDFPLRGCIIVGGRMGWNFSANPNHLLRLSQERFALDLGIGADISLGGKWVLQPSMLYSHGLNDLHYIAEGKYDWVVGRIMRDRLALVRLSLWKRRY